MTGRETQSGSEGQESSSVEAYQNRLSAVQKELASLRQSDFTGENKTDFITRLAQLESEIKQIQDFANQAAENDPDKTIEWRKISAQTIRLLKETSRLRERVASNKTTGIDEDTATDPFSEETGQPNRESSAEFSYEEEKKRVEKTKNRLVEIKKQLESKKTISEEEKEDLLLKLTRIEEDLIGAKEFIKLMVELDPENKTKWLTVIAEIMLCLKIVKTNLRKIEDLTVEDDDSSSTASVPVSATSGVGAGGAPPAGGGGAAAGAPPAGGGGAPTHYTDHDYPPMGEYDLAKRFLLSTAVGLFEHEKVKNWGFADIVQGLFLYIKMFLSRDYNLDRPFIAQDLLAKEGHIKPPGEDGRKISVKQVLTELCQENTQTYLDRVTALAELTKKATEHQPMRVRPEQNAAEIISTVTLDSSIFEGLFDVDDEDNKGNQVELRARGVPVSNAVLLRFLLVSMYNRGLNLNKKERESHPTPFEQDPDGTKVAYKKAIKQLSNTLFEIIRYIKNKKIDKNYPDDERWKPYEKLFKDISGIAPDYPRDEDEQLVDDDTLERVAKEVVMEAFNLGDVLLFRAIHDLNCSRHDELDIARLHRYRLSQEKYYEYNQNGVYSGARGGAEIDDKGIIAFFESLYKPICQRIRTRPLYLVKEEGGGKHKFRIESAERNLIEAMRSWEIPSRNLVPKEEVEKFRELFGEIEKIKDKIFVKEKLITSSQTSEEKREKYRKEITALKSKQNTHFEKLMSLIESNGLTDKIPTRKRGEPYEGGLVVTSLEDLIRKHYPADVEAEVKKINHVKPVRDALSGWDVDMGSLVKHVNREGTDSTFVSFNTEYASKLSSLLRSSFYYWIQDYNVKSLSVREYEELVRNFPEPKRVDFISEGEYEKAFEFWKREYSWRGIPLRIYERMPGGRGDDLMLDDENEPIVKYYEYQINHLFNLHVDLDKLESQKRITKHEHLWHKQDFNRVFGAEDQLTALMKIMSEKVIMIQIKKFVSDGQVWTSEHTDALESMMSSQAFEKDRSGARGLILRRRKGYLGLFDGPGDVYEGTGIWESNEVKNMVKSVLGPLKSYKVKPKE